VSKRVICKKTEEDLRPKAEGGLDPACEISVCHFKKKKEKGQR
jgi:hypothetical protein